MTMMTLHPCTSHVRREPSSRGRPPQMRWLRPGVVETMRCWWPMQSRCAAFHIMCRKVEEMAS